MANEKVVELIIRLSGIKDALRDLNSLEQTKNALNKAEINLKLNTNDLRRQKLELERELDRLQNQRRDIVFGQAGIKDAKKNIDYISDALKRVQIEAERVRLDGGDNTSLLRTANALKEQVQYWREVDHAVKNSADGMRGYDQRISAAKASIQDIGRQLEANALSSRELSVAQKTVTDEIKLRKKEEQDAARAARESSQQAKSVAAAYREVRASMQQSADKIKELRAEQLKRDFEDAWAALQKLNTEYDAFQKKQISDAGRPGEIIQQIGKGMSDIGGAFKRIGGLFVNRGILDSLQYFATTRVAGMMTQNWGDAITRYDILATYSDYLDMVGVSAEKAGESLATLNAGIQGIPIGLSDVAYQARMYQMYVDDLERATNLAIGLERALVAGGANEQMRNTARYEIDRLLSAGELSTTRQYRALMQGLGVSSRFLREEMGYGDLTNAQFITKLFEKEISGDELIRGIESLASSDKLNHAIEVYRTTIESGLSNIRFALTRGKANILDALNESLEAGTGKNISGWLYEIRDAINEVYTSATNWVRTNPERIRGVVDSVIRVAERLKDVDWASIVEGVISGVDRLINTFVNLSENIPDGWFEIFFVFSTVYATPIGTGLQIIGNALQKFGSALSTVTVAMAAYNLNAVFMGEATITLGSVLAKLAPAIPVLLGLAAAILAVDNAMHGTERAIEQFGFDLGDLERHAKNSQVAIESAMAFEPASLKESSEALSRAKELLKDIRLGGDVAAEVKELTELFPELDLAVDKTNGTLTEASRAALKSADAVIEYQTALKALSTIDSDSSGLRTNIELVNKQIEEARANLDKLYKAREGEKLRVGESYEFSSYGLIGLEKQIEEEEANLAKLLSTSEKLGRDAQTVGQRKDAAERKILEMASKIPGFIGDTADSAIAAIDAANEKLTKLQEENQKLQENYQKALDEMFSGFGKYEAPKAVKFGDLYANVEKHLEEFLKLQENLDSIRKHLITNPNQGLASYVDSLYQQGDVASINAIAQKLAKGDTEALEKIGDKYAELMAGKALEAQKSTIIAALAKYGPEEVIRQYTSGELGYGGDLEQVFLEYFEAQARRLERLNLGDKIKRGDFLGGETTVGEDPHSLLHPDRKIEFNLSDYLYMRDPEESGAEIAEKGEEAIEEAKRQLEERLQESGSLISSITGISDEDFEKQKEEYAAKAKELVEAIVGSMKEATEALSSDEEGLTSGVAQADDAFKLILEEAIPPFVEAITLLAESVQRFASEGFDVLRTSADDLTLSIQALTEALEQLFNLIQSRLYVLLRLAQNLQAVRTSASEAATEVRGLAAAIDALHDKTVTITVNIVGAEGLGDLGGGGGGTTPHTGGLIGGDGKVRYFAKGGLLSNLFKPVGTDTIPAMLTPGEYVMRRGAVDQLGVPFLQRLNRLDIAGALDNLMRRFYRPSAAAYSVVNNSNDNRAYTVTQYIETNNPDYSYRVAARFAHSL